MSTIVHLQGLPSEASSQDVRDFFEGLEIADGGVHITTSSDGSVFVTFESDLDAEAAVDLNGRRIFGVPVRLSMCSRGKREWILRQLEEQMKGPDAGGFEQDYEWQSEGSLYQEDRQNSDKFDVRKGSKYGVMFEGRSERGRRHWTQTAERNVKYYLRMRNLARDTNVENIMTFFKGIRAAIPVDGILLRNEVADTDTIAAFVKFESKRAHQIALKMDESFLNGMCILIRDCSHEMYELEETLSPVTAVTPPPSRAFSFHAHQNQDQELMRIRENQKKYVVVVRNLDNNVIKNDVQNLMKRKLKNLRHRDINIKDDYNKANHKIAFVTIYGDDEDLTSALSFDTHWFRGKQLMVSEHYRNQDGRVLEKHERPHPIMIDKALKGTLQPIKSKPDAFVRPPPLNETVPDPPENPEAAILFLAGLDEAVSPRDIRKMFGGTLAECIPCNGILIRPDLKRGDGYVAFVRFVDLASCHKAEGMWKMGYETQTGTNIFFSMCTEHMIKQYNIESIWQLRTMCKDTAMNDKQISRSAAHVEAHNKTQGRSRSPTIPELEMNPQEVSDPFGIPPVHKKPPVHNQVMNPALCVYPWERSEAQQAVSRSPAPDLTRVTSHARSCSSKSPIPPLKATHTSSMSMSPSPPRRKVSPSPQHRKVSPSPPRRKLSPSPPRRKLSPSPPRRKLSPSPPPRKRSPSPPRRKRLPSPPRRKWSPSPPRRKRSPNPPQRKQSPSPAQRKRSRSNSWSPVRKRGQTKWSRSSSRSPPMQRPRGRSPTISRSPSPIRDLPRRGHRTRTEHTSRRTPSPNPRVPHDGPSPGYGTQAGYRSQPARGPPIGQGMPPRVWAPNPASYRNYPEPPLGYAAPPYPPYRAPPPMTQPASIRTTDDAGRFLRVSPLPEWANEAWIYNFFSNCAVKKASVLIKFNGAKPVHAYVECETNADVSKALLMNGTAVGNATIKVEPLGNMH